MSEKLNISDLDKAEVLAALYNASHPQGLGFMHFNPKDMTRDEAQFEMNGNPGLYFDYLHGRVMKVDLSKFEFDPWLYDRDNGQGAAKKVIESIREKQATA